VLGPRRAPGAAEGAPERGERHDDRHGVLFDAQTAGVQPAGQLGCVDRPALPPGPQVPTRPRIERPQVNQPPPGKHPCDKAYRGGQRWPPTSATTLRLVRQYVSV
jgi:hypothetical protein